MYVRKESMDVVCHRIRALRTLQRHREEDRMGSFLCFAANSRGDYHGEMNVELFLRWLTTQLLAILEQPVVLVMDNAPYHSILTEERRCPTTATRKSHLIE
ncbi:hypothetical protein Pcinc_008322 [Petrolisthes cinctipes]|uniref:Tc1-like transposase DDE domain-containing protein n=1 Tax=Petrolisthes cinctipes TaxID=88211 RepID=A0AAE1KXE9_PETCI|nr:hypothetical protein Pcinc_008322 [Petrolisthes cinctipes]